MPQDRITRSAAPSPSNRRSVPSPLSVPSSPIIFCSKATARQLATPKVSKASSPNARLTPLSQPRASTVHNPPLPLIFLWRCCRSDCRANNHFFTKTHFTRLRHVRGLVDTWSWAPSYRTDKCQECKHEACEICLLLQVEGESEWKGAEAENDFGETGDVGVWRRVGFWGEGRRFGIIENQSKVRYNDVVRDLESNERVGQHWAKEWLRDRERRQRVSSR